MSIHSLQALQQQKYQLQTKCVLVSNFRIKKNVQYLIALGMEVSVQIYLKHQKYNLIVI